MHRTIADLMTDRMMTCIHSAQYIERKTCILEFNFSKKDI